MGKINKALIKTWFVTGASSGFGEENCRQLLERGYNVVAVSRKVPEIEHPNVLCLSVDVTKPETIQSAIQKGIERFGGIDVVVNHAGFSASAPLETESLESMKEVMEVDFWGTFNVIKAVLPYFRENKKGTIICNSSMSGISYRAYGAAYCSAKHAVVGLASVCRHETQGFCRVMVLEPGFFEETNVSKNARMQIVSNIPEYAKMKNFVINTALKKRNNLYLAVKHIIDTVEEEKLPLHLILGEDAIAKAEVTVKYLKEGIKRAKRNKVGGQIRKNDFISKIKRFFLLASWI